MTDPLLIADQSARHDALDVTRSWIVQAPAGSGKTELLIQRYLKLLAIVESPEEVVAITFTRKAASEMRHRVLLALAAAEQPAEGLQDFELVTREAALAVLERDQQAEWNLLETPRRMRIQTLDSLNAGIARALPLSSGLGGISQVAADASVNALYGRAAATTLDWLGERGERSDIVATVLRHQDNDAALYVNRVSSMLRNRDQWLPLLGSGQGSDADFARARTFLEDSIAKLIRVQLQRVTAELPTDVSSELPGLLDYAAGNLIDDGKPEHPIAQLHGIDQLPGTEPADVEAWKAIAKALLTDDGDIRKQVDKRSGFPTTDKQRKQAFVELLDTLRTNDSLTVALGKIRRLPAAGYSDQQWSVLVALLRLLPRAVATLKAEFAQQSVCDHVEVALAASEALGSADAPGDVAMMLDYKISHLLVDEMQDTSIGQYRLLEDLMRGWTEGDGRTLFCVGDPMQSIYRFRDAEVGQFIIARDQGVGSMLPGFLQLRQNFRSGENLVHWFNTIFSQVMPAEDDVHAGAISYTESVPAEMRRGYGAAAVHPLIDADLGEESAKAVAIVRDVLASSQDDSVAVLVRSRTQLTRFLVDLRAADIDYQAVDVDRLTDLPEIIDVIALTRALCHDGDRIAWLALLHGPLVGMRWADILLLVNNDSRSTIFDLLRDDERVAHLSADGCERAARFMRAVTEVREQNLTQSLRVRVECLWYALGGAAVSRSATEIENVYQYFDVLGRIERAGTITDIAELASVLDDERVAASGSANARVQVMTMHKSKGLQFDHVVLFALGRQSRSNEKSVLSWLSLPDAGEGELLISPIAARDDLENDPLHQFIEQTELEKQRQELDRLLYVACTRARKSLHLVASVNSIAQGKKLGKAKSGTLLNRLWPAVGAHFEAEFATRGGVISDADGNDESHLKEPLVHRLRSPMSIQVPPLAGADVELPATPESRVEFRWVGSAARHAGTITHRWLQRLADQSIDITTFSGAQQSSLSRHWGRQLGVPSGELDSVCARVEEALAGILRDDKGRWLLAGEGHAELALTGIWQGVATPIVIDRVRVDEDGTHWIVDYKTSSHEGGDVEQFLQQEADRYREQLTRYRHIYAEMVDAPVRTALYFPLLQEFREVNCD